MLSAQVEVLLEGGAIPDKEDRGGDTAESWAREWANPTCANLLAVAVEKAVERRRKRTEELTQVKEHSKENKVEEGKKEQISTTTQQVREHSVENRVKEEGREEISTTSDEAGSQVEEEARYQDTEAEVPQEMGESRVEEKDTTMTAANQKTLKVDKNKHYWATYPPRLVNLVIERPLMAK